MFIGGDAVLILAPKERHLSSAHSAPTELRGYVCCVSINIALLRSVKQCRLV